MPSLSPDPLEKTNALLELMILRQNTASTAPASALPLSSFSPTPVSIAVNCLVYSSLCFSLFAAVGAMQAKEWLQSYDRTGQAGSPEHQARVRQRKFNGAQQWHLETVILALPYLLLLSVLLFFAGVSLFLFPVNGKVAWVVIAICSLGVSSSSLTIILGSTSPLCPYQTAASRGLRRGGKLVGGTWKQCLIILRQLPLTSVNAWQSAIKVCRRQWAEIFPPRSSPTTTSPHGFSHMSSTRILIKPIATVWSNLVKQFDATFDVLPRHSHATQVNPSKRNKDLLHDDHILNAEAAGWFLEITADKQDQLVLARNICSLNSVGCDTLLGHARAWRRLSSWTLEAI